MNIFNIIILNNSFNFLSEMHVIVIVIAIIAIYYFTPMILVM